MDKSKMEPAEGSRENVNVGGDQAGNQGGRGTSTMKRDEQSRGAEDQDRGERASEVPPAAFGEGEHGEENAGGISNRPLDEEQGRQENLPPRGERRENWKED